jgi:outer membrane protein OmpA-like peptidoglycan-associated protein
MRKPAAFGLALLALLVVVGLAAALYLGRQGKKAPEEARNNLVPQPAPAPGGTNQGAQPDSDGSASAFSEWKPPADHSQPFADGKIPLVPELTVVTAIAQPLVGDYESIKRVEAVNPEGLRISFSSDLPNPKLLDPKTGKETPGPGTRRKGCVRTVLSQDMKNAREYRENFCVADQERYPGTTAISVSTQVLTELKTKGEASFKYQSTAYTTGPPDASCVLRRVEPMDLAVPVLVNDRRVQLPAVHASCPRPFFGEAEFYLLDDPDDPLALAWQLVEGNKLQVVKITLPAKDPQIEQSLLQSGRAEVHGIYFDFSSATIRPESEPVLKEIVHALADNPKWRLRVEGHTDNVGGDDYNRELSNRRAAAVKQTLVEQYRVAGDRLTTAGFGASRPRETNDTLEGRARNRRVELVLE